MPISMTAMPTQSSKSGNGIEVAYARRVPIQQPSESSATWPSEISPTRPYSRPKPSATTE